MNILQNKALSDKNHRIKKICFVILHKFQIQVEAGNFVINEDRRTKHYTSKI